MLDIAKESLLAIKNLNYPNYEVIILDNGSKDNSIKQLTEYSKSIKLDSKIVYSKNNLGFAGGSNLAYQYRDKSSKYVVPINSDLIPDPDSLGKFIEVAESDNRIGSVQGIILNPDDKVICAGCYLDEMLDSYVIMSDLGKEKSVTYCEASFCVFKIEAMQNIQKDYIFDEELFAYFEDALLGLKFWNYKYRNVFAPIMSGRHYLGKSSNSQFRRYSRIKNMLALHRVIHTNYGRLFMYKALALDYLKYLISSPFSSSFYTEATAKGIILGSKLKNKGIKLSLYKAPYIRLKPSLFFLPRRKIKVSSRDIMLPTNKV